MMMMIDNGVMLMTDDEDVNWDVDNGDISDSELKVRIDC